MNKKMFLSQDRTPSTPCPGCQMVNDATTGASTEGFKHPKPGNVTICLHCGTICIFQKDMSLAIASDDEVRAINPELLTLMRGYVQKFRRQHVS